MQRKGATICFLASDDFPTTGRAKDVSLSDYIEKEIPGTQKAVTRHGQGEEI